MAYSKITVIKQQRAQGKSDKINEGRTLTARDNIKGFAYAKGMAGPQHGADQPESVDDSQNKKKPPAKKSICPYCNKNGHKTTKSKSCLFSIVPDWPHYRENNDERATGKLLCRLL
jgi:hypothetical protein